MKENFHAKLKRLINAYILLGYEISGKFPSDEKYGMRSQARRALLSVMLNYVEGYARKKKAVTLNFYETSFGSLKESIYVFYLACKLKHITTEDYKQLFTFKEQIAQMFWKTMEGVEKDIKEEKKK